MTSSWNSTGQDADHARPHPGGAFLGYDVTVQHSRDPARRQRRGRAARPPAGDQGQMRPLPQARQTRAARRADEPADRLIISTYGAEYRGIVQYYLLASNVFRLHPAPLGSRDLDAQDAGCAMRRTAISPAKRAEMRGDYLWI